MTVKRKRNSTEEKIRILMQADAGQSIGDVCLKHNLSQVSFHR
jgi:transposase-like protein